jgi:flagellar hook assembly protein FlgD
MMKKVFIFLMVSCVIISVSFAAKVYPNPWIPDSAGDTHGTLAGGITFDELPNTGGEIDIYNTTGELVRRLRWDLGTSINWDGRNDKGDYVASGVYIWTIKDGGKGSKIIIVR